MTAKRSRKRVASVREYVASKPKESRASLEAVRRAILKALPNAQEGLAYQMPAYTLNGMGVLYFAGWMSHGTPCFFVEQGKGCFAMVSEHHRDDGRLSLWVPVADGLQPLMIEESPDIYFYPRYVGAGGWVGILLDQIADDALESHLREARRIIASKRKPARKPRGM